MGIVVEAGYHPMATARGPVSGSLLSVLTPEQAYLDLLFIWCCLETFIFVNVLLRTAAKKGATLILKMMKLKQRKVKAPLLHHTVATGPR